MNYTIQQLLKTLFEQKGSDLHISINTPPRIRINGVLYPLEIDPLTKDDTKSLCYSVLTEEQKKVFENEKELDLSFSVKGLARFRCNIFKQKEALSAVFRLIPHEILSTKQLNLPQHFDNLCNLSRGLVLVTGPTGSGKSTTLAAMIDHINRTRQDHILTIEDPVEFVHQHKNCLINQREVGFDTKSFQKALKSALRQDPDVILIGELRDLETISLALTIAETGHLVFATLHTSSCVSTLNRIIDVFPPHQQLQVRTQLSMSLQAVISQNLIKSTKGGRELALETMFPDKGIRALMREGKLHQIYSAMQSGQATSKMQTMNQSLVNLLSKRLITRDDAFSRTTEPEELAEIIKKTSRVQSR